MDPPTHPEDQKLARHILRSQSNGADKLSPRLHLGQCHPHSRRGSTQFGQQLFC